MTTTPEASGAVTEAHPPCRFGDGPAAVVLYTPNGCVCFPDDRIQALCEQHFNKDGMGDGWSMIRDYRAARQEVVPASGAVTEAMVWAGAEVQWAKLKASAYGSLKDALERWPYADSLPNMMLKDARDILEAALARQEAVPVAPSDPHTILEGIRQFGLAADGSDLRDLAVRLEALEKELAAAKDYRASYDAFMEAGRELFEDRYQENKQAVREAERQLAEARKALDGDAELEDDLLYDWRKDFAEGLGKDARGSMVWAVNAGDIMRLIRTIDATRAALAQGGGSNGG